MRGKRLLSAVAVFLFLLSSCSGDGGTGGSGGDGDGGGNNPPPTTQKPTAAFTTNPGWAAVGVNFTFDAGASYDEQDLTSNLEVRWDFENDGTWDTDYSTAKIVTHAYDTEGEKTVKLEVEDTDGNTNTTTIKVSVISASSPHVSGVITFQKVPITEEGLKGIVPKPARRIAAQVVRSSDQMVGAEVYTDNSGAYSFQVPSNSTIYIRAVARIDDGSAKVVVTPPGSGLVFTAISGNITMGTIDKTGQNFLILDSNRGSGPFNILDVILQAYDMVHTANPSVTLPDLNVRWSSSNSNGTYYDGYNNIYICGMRTSNCGQQIDSDEFDDHVVVHEYGHFVSFQLYRDDSLGGSHRLWDRLDVRVAYSEGFANAFCGMALNDRLYLDSVGTNGSIIGVDFNMEANSEQSDAYDDYANEISVCNILWDLFDSNNDTARSKTDTLSYGFGPLNNAWTNTTLKTGADLMYLYPVVDRLIALSGNEAATSAILGMENVLYPEPAGSTFTDVSLGGSRNNVYIDGTHAPNDDGFNKYAANRFYRFKIGVATNVRVSISNKSPSGLGLGIYLIRKGVYVSQTSSSTLSVSNLAAGTYVVNIQAASGPAGTYNISIGTF